MSTPDPRPSLDLLEANHVFPGVYQIKAIGNVADDFEARLLDLVRADLADPADLEHAIRATPGGRHVAVTMAINVQDAEQVRGIYQKIRAMEGLVLLL